jgi:hypothetical protein
LQPSCFANLTLLDYGSSSRHSINVRFYELLLL